MLITKHISGLFWSRNTNDLYAEMAFNAAHEEHWSDVS